MSKKQDYSNDVLHDIETMTIFELSKLYGIEVNGTEIYDPVEHKTFNSLHEWATFYDEVNNEVNNFSKINRRYDWDDEYY
jgi:hypothetical protein